MGQVELRLPISTIRKAGRRTRTTGMRNGLPVIGCLLVQVSSSTTSYRMRSANNIIRTTPPRRHTPLNIGRAEPGFLSTRLHTNF